jgi:predicted ATPase
MLQSIQFQNFKSYRGAATLHLAPLTFLIGANASGKSNALEALRLLSWLARGKQLDDVVRDLAEAKSSIRGGFQDLFGDKAAPIALKLVNKVFHKTSDKFSIINYQTLTISISIRNNTLVVSSESCSTLNHTWLYRTKEIPRTHTDEIQVEYNNQKGGKNPTITCSYRQPIFYQLQSATRFPSAHKSEGLLISKIATQLKDALSNIFFLDPKPERMRGYASQFTAALDENGANLSGVLYKLVNTGQKAALLDFIKFLPEQNFVDIDFIVVEQNNDVMVQLVETFGDSQKKVNAPLLSDGTLRVMAIAAALLSAPPGSIVVVEEVDNGVHPSRAHDLVTQIKKIAEANYLQVLLSSHNPAMIDAIPPDAIGDIVACYRDAQTGDSRLTRLRDLDDFAELVLQGSVGELMKKQILDKYLNPKFTPEEVVQKNLAWLESLLKTEQEAS